MIPVNAIPYLPAISYSLTIPEMEKIEHGNMVPLLAHGSARLIKHNTGTHPSSNLPSSSPLDLALATNTYRITLTTNFAGLLLTVKVKFCYDKRRNRAWLLISRESANALYSALTYPPTRLPKSLKQPLSQPHPSVVTLTSRESRIRVPETDPEPLRIPIPKI